MKRVIREQENIFAMSKIRSKYAIPEVAQYVDNFIYFSECNSSHGPRIKFYGGTKETSTTQKSPSLAFDLNGDCSVELESWMDKKVCPNAYDASCIQSLEQFIKRYKPLLLLVWFGHLDEADALEYFHGHLTFENLMSDIEPSPTKSITTLYELDVYCKENNLYTF